MVTEAAAAPTIDDSKIAGFTSSTSVHNFPTSGLTVSGKRILAIFGNNGAAADLSSFTGDGTPADTSTEIKAYSTGPHFHVREVTVNDTLDTNWVLTLDASGRPVISTLALGSLDTVLSYTIEAGTGPTLPSHLLRNVTGGPYNLLVIHACLVQGAHVANPPLVPTGFTLVEPSTASLSNNPTGSAVTLAIAQKTYAVADLPWSGGAVNVPAASWTGLANIGTEPWRTATLICRSE